MSRFGRWGVIFLTMTSVVTVVLLVSGAASAAKSGTTLATFNTHGTYSWKVPNGIKRVTFDVFGASGGNFPSFGLSGGLGGEATATFTVQGGQVFEVVVGGRGDEVGENHCPVGGFNGGGSSNCSEGGSGGGGTDIRSGTCAANQSCDLNGRFIVAGGGGGAGSTGNGGGGGGYVGGDALQDGTSCGTGTGGTQTSGGVVGGSFGVGGEPDADAGGAGGGGWYGGGGSSLFVGSCNEGGGGGGSGFIAPWAMSGAMQAGVHSGDGLVVISKA